MGKAGSVGTGREEECSLAIAYMDVRIISRSNGQSAVRAAVYRSGEKIYCEYTDHVYFYPRKHEEVIHSQVFLPGNAPERLKDRAVLWNEVEWIEPKSTSQLAREIKIALPRELSGAQNIALARDFVQALAERGMVGDLSIHDKGDGNPHAHIMLTMRPFNQNGTWGMKSREVFLLDEHGERILLSSGRYKSFKVCTTDWDTKEALLEWRKLYQDITNEHLARAGVDARICVASYEKQGIDRESTVHLGHYAHAQEKQGIPTRLGDLNREINARNALREIFASKFAEWVEEVRGLLNAKTERQVLLQQHLAAWEATSQVVLSNAIRLAESMQRTNEPPSAFRSKEAPGAEPVPPEPPTAKSTFRQRYDERNQGLREGKLLPEQVFQPWQEELLARSFQVEEEKAQPAYIHALLLSQRTALRSPEVEPQPHHERTMRNDVRSSHYAERVRTIREKRKLYDERNQQRREGKWTPERAFEPWQEELLERSFQVEYEKGQPAYINTLLFTSGQTSPRVP